MPPSDNSVAEHRNSLPADDDISFAARMRDLYAHGKQALVVVNRFTACLYCRPDAITPWIAVCRGEFGEEGLQCAIDHRTATWWLESDGSPWDFNQSLKQPERAKKGVMQKWLGIADKVTHREGEVTQAIKDGLTYLAGWRCQFAGCGVDLRHHPATGRRGRFSYFAHIVAASKDGPRGDEELSPKLASDPENFLLLCDACHRLIDKRDPDFYTAEKLNKMRAESIAAVRSLLDTLKYPEALPIAILGNITGQQGQLRHEDAMAAMWAARLRASAGNIEHFFRLGGNLHAIHEAGYWSSLFLGMRQEISRLQGILNGTSVGGGIRPRLAIFPLHATSVLLLTGRLLGDNDATHVFQPRRDNVTGSTRWLWPVSQELVTPPLEFTMDVLKERESESNEATLLLYLTADIAVIRLPEPIADADGWKLPTIRVGISTPNPDCIERPEDLKRLGIALDQAIRQMQDGWQIKCIHLIVCAPTSASVTLGQKMQARHHANYVCYEAVGGAGSPYKATIEIGSDSVRELVSGIGASAPLQL